MFQPLKCLRPNKTRPASCQRVGRPKAPLVLAFLLLATLPSCRRESQPDESARPSGQRTIPDNTLEAPPPQLRPEKRAVKADIHNVMFHLTADASALLENLSGELWPVGKYDMPDFDDKTSFELHVANGTISISPSALANAMNAYTLAANDSPLKDISAEINDNRLILRGKLHSKKDLPFETAGELTVNSDGRLRLRTEEVKAIHVPVRKVMALFGIELTSIINTNKMRGIDTDQDDLLIDLGELLPPPHIRGHIASARLGTNQITLVYGDGASHSSPLAPGNYIVLRGNRVKFGSLIMEGTDLYLLDLDPEDPMDWYQDRYKEQLVPGYVHITNNFGLRTYVKDFAKLPKRTPTSSGSDRSTR